MPLLIREEYTNATKGYHFGDSGEPYEPFTDDIGRLFASLRREYGRASKVYVDLKAGGPPHHVGWCFTKRIRYEDARGNDPERDFYDREVWVTLYEPCDVDDSRACTTRSRTGAVTRHPFRQLDVDAYRRQQRKAAA